MPERSEIGFDCTCPDWDDPCKHAVAVMITFSEEIALDPSLLVRWRGGQPNEPRVRAVVGSRASRAARLSPTTAAGLDAETKAALAAFLGTATDLEIGPVSQLRPPTAAWGELWAEMLADALEVLTTGARPL